SQFSYSSYNVLIDSNHASSTERIALLAEAILSNEAADDVLLLQEVSDDFLSKLLALDAIRERYPYVSHGPPDQDDIPSFTSMHSAVALSRWNFNWYSLPFKRQHKGAVIISIPEIYREDEDEAYPLVIAGIHLVCGLTDESVAAKKSQLATLISHLQKHHPSNPWIVSGGFNLTTSAFTIDQALKTKSISLQAVSTLASLDHMLFDASLQDAYFLAPINSTSVSKVRLTHAAMEELYEGEQGATFDPLHNRIAADIVGTGMNRRPQRYDRILFKDADVLRLGSFSMFGLPETLREGTVGNDTPKGKEQSPQIGYGSGHWGVRTTFNVACKSDSTDSASLSLKHPSFVMPPVPATIVTHPLDDFNAVVECLRQNPLHLTTEDQAKRTEIYVLLKMILNQTLSGTPNAQQGASFVKFKIELVGSGALGTADALSDIDIICLGAVSPPIFFSLAISRLKKAKDNPYNVTILRKVDASSGTMLELLVRGIRVDLHYCTATKFLERWPESIYLAHNNLAYRLSGQSIDKLQPLRDILYLKRTIPDMAKFRLAVLFLKAWARGRGIYSTRFGYLGGVHITLMLSSIYKSLLHQRGHDLSIPGLIGTFFTYYSQFDWNKYMVCDPHMPYDGRYFRSAQEPMVILTMHAPKKNVAKSATVPTVRAIVFELSRAAHAVRAYTDPLKWFNYCTTSSELRGPDSRATGASEFLRNSRTLLQINVHYWGGSVVKGGQFLGWLESKLLTISVELSKAIAPYFCRIWPGRFAQPPLLDSTSYFGCYLLSIRRCARTDGLFPSTTTVSVAVTEILSQFCEKFCDQIRQNEKYYDPASCGIDAALVSGKEVQDLVLDTRNWGMHAAEDLPPDDEFGEEDDLVVDGDPSANEPNNQSGHLAGGPRQDSVVTERAGPVPQTSHAPLRTSADVLNRILWDEIMDTDDYVIGYEDRFLGVQEIPARRWKKNTTDEEFIPMHRVVYFRRKSDDVKVWDKPSRTDLVFGTGLTSDSQ
ncbi:hypothetical protein P152DRAFT_368296, partial [Eremomyces bilateralis CBS 781.70]